MDNEDSTPQLPGRLWIPQALGSLAGSIRGALPAIESMASVVRAGVDDDGTLEELDDELAELEQLVAGTRRALQRCRGRSPRPGG